MAVDAREIGQRARCYCSGSPPRGSNPLPPPRKSIFPTTFFHFLGEGSVLRPVILTGRNPLPPPRKSIFPATFSHFLGGGSGLRPVTSLAPRCLRGSGCRNRCADVVWHAPCLGLDTRLRVGRGVARCGRPVAVPRHLAGIPSHGYIRPPSPDRMCSPSTRF